MLVKRHVPGREDLDRDGKDKRRAGDDDADPGTWVNKPKRNLAYALKTSLDNKCMANVQSVGSGRFVSRFGKANVNATTREPLKYEFRMEGVRTAG